MQNNRLHFSQKHPLLFGFFLIFTAVALLVGAMAFFHVLQPDFGAWFGRSRIGLVHVRGTITESRSVNDWIGRLRRDDSVKGVLVRINSPGGSVAPSQEIFQALKDLAAVKPVAVSMGTVAASGGYYVACAGNPVWANPGTLTGSIGVKLQMAGFRELAERLGIRDRTVSSGPLKNAGSPLAPLTPEQQAYFQGLVDDLHDQFVTDVARARGMDRNEVLDLADGRALSGRQALEAGLVDRLGTREQALAELEHRLGLGGEIELVEGPEIKKSLLSRVLGLVGFSTGSRVGLAPQWTVGYEQ
jgi:protease-4